MTDSSHEKTPFSEIAEAMFESLQIGILFCDHNGIIQYVNQAFISLFGPDAHLAVGQKAEYFCPLTPVYEVMASGIPRRNIPCGVCAQKSYRIDLIPLKTEEGAIKGVIAQFLPVGEAQEEKLRAAIKQQTLKISKYRRLFHTSVKPWYTFADLVSLSEAISRVMRRSLLFSKLTDPVLITGERGLLKERFAQCIHCESRSSNSPFISVPYTLYSHSACAQIMFGDRDGERSSLHGRFGTGLLELSKGGTLYFKEIGGMPLSIQDRLLSMLKNGMSETGGRTINSFRLMASTSADLSALVENGAFRSELYDLLLPLTLEIPPLRENPEDIPWIIKVILSRLSREDASLTPEAEAALQRYSWPGNVWQLREALVNALAKCRGQISLEHLPSEIKSLACDAFSCSNRLAEAAAIAEADKISKTLASCQFNVSATARKLGISRATLYAKMRRYSIEPSPPPPPVMDRLQPPE